MSLTNNQKPQGTRKQWVWIMLMVNIVFVLLLMTLGILALRIGNSLPKGTDILFIVGKNPQVDVEDSNGKWQEQKNSNVDIFKAEYKNGEGKSTVVSQDGTKVIAPGVTTSYKFTIQNSGNMAILYQTDLRFTLKIGEEVQENYYFPLKVRLLNDSGEYVIGSETQWVSVHEAVLWGYPGLLGANSFETFEFQLMWEFEGGCDELDTYYGDLSAEKGVYLTLKIKNYAEEAPDPTAQGGNRIEVKGTPEYGGTIRWLWLTLLMINAAILVFYIAWLLNKRTNKW